MHTITLSIPDTKTIKEKALELFETLGEQVSDASAAVRQRSITSVSKKWSNLPNNKKRFIFVVLAALAFTITAIRITPFLFKKTNSSTTVAGSNVKHAEINREFDFPLRGAEGEETGTSLKYVVVGADLTDQIIIQGKMATAAQNRLFLIVNLKLENPTQTPLSIKTRDFIRLTPEGSVDRLAPDIHNDPAEVQPISTKITRVGFPVDETIKNFSLYIGEINGEKQEIPLNFQ